MVQFCIKDIRLNVLLVGFLEVEEDDEEILLWMEEEDFLWFDEVDDGWGFRIFQFFDKVIIKNNLIDEDNDDVDDEDKIDWEVEMDDGIIKEIIIVEWEMYVFVIFSFLVVYVFVRYGFRLVIFFFFLFFEFSFKSYFDIESGKNWMLRMWRLFLLWVYVLDYFIFILSLLLLFV